MVQFASLGDTINIVDQLKEDDAPIVLVNVFTVDPDEVDDMMSAWTQDAM